MSDETLQQDPVLRAIAELSRKIDENQKVNNERFDQIEKHLAEHDIQFETIRRGISENSVRFDQLEILAMDAKSVALMARSQLTILTEELKQSKILV